MWNTTCLTFLTKYLLGQHCCFARTWFRFIVTCLSVLQSRYNMSLLEGSIFYYQNPIFRKICSQQKTNVLKTQSTRKNVKQTIKYFNVPFGKYIPVVRNVRFGVAVLGSKPGLDHIIFHAFDRFCFPFLWLLKYRLFIASKLVSSQRTIFYPWNTH